VEDVGQLHWFIFYINIFLFCNDWGIIFLCYQKLAIAKLS